MYDDLFDAETPPSDRELFERATADVSVGDEIRLARSRLGAAVAAKDDKGMLNWLGLVHALVRIQSGLGEGEGPLAQMIAEVGDEIRREALAR